ncbi:PAS domain-containing protein [Hymenobacter humi]|uniref:PAS domain-containing protein n=1 Tax=Hymenobacter humi TaxID=1411620 RepID=A0ABW2UDH5_9BACT
MSADHLFNAPRPTDTGEPALLPQQVLQALPWAVLVLQRSGKFSLVNAQAEHLLGCAAGALVGRPLAEALPDDLPAEVQEALHEAARAPGPVTGEFWLPRPECWIEMTTQPGPTEVLVYWQDITRQVNQRRQLGTEAFQSEPARGNLPPLAPGYAPVAQRARRRGPDY